MAGSFKDDAGESGNAQLIYDVSDVSVDLISGDDGLQMQITAQGHTRTGGWTDVALVRDDEASDDSHAVYRFVGVRPTGIATQMITPVEVTVLVPLEPNRIQVVAETNEMTGFHFVE